MSAGDGAAAACHRWGTPALWCVAFLGMALAVKGLDDLIPGPPSLLTAAGLTWLGLGGLPWQPGLAPVGPWPGIAVTVGMLVHCLGDALTSSGCPLLWPLPIQGQTWHPLRLPRWVRFRTGGPAEWVVLVACNVALLWLAVAVVPGLQPVLTEVGRDVGAGLSD